MRSHSVYELCMNVFVWIFYLEIFFFWVFFFFGIWWSIFASMLVTWIASDIFVNIYFFTDFMICVLLNFIAFVFGVCVHRGLFFPRTWPVRDTSRFLPISPTIATAYMNVILGTFQFWLCIQNGNVVEFVVSELWIFRWVMSTEKSGQFAAAC